MVGRMNIAIKLHNGIYTGLFIKLLVFSSLFELAKFGYSVRKLEYFEFFEFFEWGGGTGRWELLRCQRRGLE